ncbi:hypothetical protein [Microbacterium testaceum]|uniref:Uncharacterized protein n=1 Tax=Microbacterium testaceum TaxID=2033 RepID=A0A2T7VPJ8_MICTE|nr:hypothetical protein [Microbacterium testaceum]PVE58702.1 hypothetical protein DC432_16115 [Microbacterium testaceum]
MPFHSKATLEHWVTEFVDARNAGEEIRVVVQDGSDGDDTGLVVMPMEHLPNSVWIEPCDSGDELSWHVLIEPGAETLNLTSFELNALTHDLQVAAELCAFLHERSLGHYEPQPEPDGTPEAATAD